jgi:hypothetical protein
VPDDVRNRAFFPAPRCFSRVAEQVAGLAAEKFAERRDTAADFRVADLNCGPGLPM